MGIVSSDVSRNQARGSAIAKLLTYTAAGTTPGAVAGAGSATLGTLVDGPARAAAATLLGLLAAVVGVLELAGHRVPVPQFDRETPQSWMNRGPYRALRNGTSLGLGFGTRTGEFAWYSAGVGRRSQQRHFPNETIKQVSLLPTYFARRHHQRERLKLVQLEVLNAAHDASAPTIGVGYVVTRRARDIQTNGNRNTVAQARPKCAATTPASPLSVWPWVSHAGRHGRRRYARPRPAPGSSLVALSRATHARRAELWAA